MQACSIPLLDGLTSRLHVFVRVLVSLTTQVYFDLTLPGTDGAPCKMFSTTHIPFVLFYMSRSLAKISTAVTITELYIHTGALRVHTIVFPSSERRSILKSINRVFSRCKSGSEKQQSQLAIDEALRHLQRNIHI